MRIPELIAWLTVFLGILPLLLVGFTAAQASTSHLTSPPSQSLSAQGSAAATPSPIALAVTPPLLVIDAVQPEPPACVLRSADQPALRQLSIYGRDLPAQSITLQFQHLSGGLTFTITHPPIVARADDRLVVDMGRETPFSWSAPRHVLAVRFVADHNGDIIPLSNWSSPFIAADSAEACSSTPVVVARHAVEMPDLDGRLTEWDTLPVVTLDAGTAATVYGNPPSPPHETTAALRMTWDDTYVYVAVQVMDDQLNVDGQDYWRNDGIELAFDGNWDQIGPGGPTDHTLNLGLDGVARDFGTPSTSAIVITQSLSGGYIIEAALPAVYLLTRPPTADVVVGFTWALRDNDDGGDWDSWLIWAGNETLTHYSQFGELYLLN